MAESRHHKQCLRRAKQKRDAGVPSCREYEEMRLERAWRNIFVKSGFVKPLPDQQPLKKNIS